MRLNRVDNGCANSRSTFKHGREESDRLRLGSSSFTLWAPQELPASECVVGAMALELERVKEALQKQTDIAIRADTAIGHMLKNTRETQQRLANQVDQLEEELVVVSGSKKEGSTEYGRLYTERERLQQDSGGLHEEVQILRASLASDRATLSHSVKNSQIKELALEDMISKLKIDNERKGELVNTMQRRVEKESEVIDAVRSQLYDYRQMVTQLNPKSSNATDPAGITASRQVQGGTALDDDLAGCDVEVMEVSPFLTNGSAATPRAPHQGQTQQVSRTRQAGMELRSESSITALQVENSAPLPLTPFEANKLSLPFPVPSPTEGALPSPSTKDPLGSNKDFVAAQLTEMRRLRRFGPEPDAMGGMPIAMDGGTAGAKSSPGGGATVMSSSQMLTHRGGPGAPASGKRREQWRPNYETVVLQDLFIAWGDMTDHMLQTQAAVLSMLKDLENEFLDIYKFYSSLGGLHIYNDRQCMTKKQLIKSGFLYEDQVEEVFKMMSERAAVHDDYHGSTLLEYVSFDLFPETICRLAAAKYEWRPPENNDEADEEVELPETLKKSLLVAREDSLKNKPRRSNPIRSFDTTSLTNEVLGAKPTDKVLFIMIKTYVFIDLLNNARRTKTAGSVLGHQRAAGRSTPASVWMK
eukprot:gene31751-6949_t